MDAPDAPVLTETALSNGLPTVEVYFPTLDSDAVRITVWRIADGVREAVRGMELAPVAGDFVETDVEVPFGVVSTYVGEIFDVDGASITGEQATIQVDCDEVWIQDQVDPENSLPLYMDLPSRQALTGDAVAEIRRVRRTSKQFVFGKHRPFLQNFGLGGIEGLQLDAYTESEEALSRMSALMQVSPILVRTPPVFAMLPRLLSADVASPGARPDWQSSVEFRHLWLLTVDEVEPISKALIKPLVTWADWETAFPEADFTYTDVELLYSAGTWTDAVRNPPVS